MHIPSTILFIKNSIFSLTSWLSARVSPRKIAELGTGTAAIPLALCSELTDLHILTVDVFPKVIEVANKNIQKYEKLLTPRNNSIELILNNLFPDSLEEQDFIISNPPYVRSNDISNKQEHHKMAAILHYLQFSINIL